MPSCARDFPVAADHRLPVSLNFIAHCMCRSLRNGPSNGSAVLDFGEKLLGLMDCSFDGTYLRRVTGVDAVVKHAFVAEDEEADNQYS